MLEDVLAENSADAATQKPTKQITSTVANPTSDTAAASNKSLSIDFLFVFLNFVDNKSVSRQTRD